MEHEKESGVKIAVLPNQTQYCNNSLIVSALLQRVMIRIWTLMTS